MRYYVNQNKIYNHFKEKGWVKIEKFISEKKINNIKKNIETFLKSNLNNYNSRYINFVNNNKKFSNINSFHKLDDCKQIKKLSKNKKIINMVNNLLKTNKIKLRQSEYFAKPKKTGLKVPDHQDNYYWNILGGNALTIWIAITKSEINNGSIHYYEGSHKNGILKHKASYSKGSSQTIKNTKLMKMFKKVSPNLNKGDAIIHHSLIVHGSLANKSNLSRRGLTFQFKEKNAKIDSKNMKKYEKALLNQIKQRG